VGVALALAGVRILVASAPANVPRLASTAVDLRVLAATLGISLAAGLLFGLVPALHARGVDLQSTLKADSGRGAVGVARTAFRSVLVAGELALAIMLLAGAGLLIRSFWNLLSVDPGFRAGGVLKAEYQLPQSRYPAAFATWPDFREQHAFVAAILARAATLPGVTSAAVAGNHPLDPGFTNSFLIVGRENEAREPGWPELAVRRVTPGYFSTVGVPLVRGRLLSEGDGTRSAPVVLINEASARRFFGERDPVGAQLRLYGMPRTIVGVVANERTRGGGAAAPLATYLPLAQAPSVDGAGVLLVKTSGHPAAAAAPVRDVIHERDPALAVFGLELLDRTVSRSVADRRFAMLLVGLFASLALVLAAIGVHGVLSYDVARRVREIGIRMALGAERGLVVRLIVGRALALAAIGVAVGGAGAFALTRTLSTLLFGVTPYDPATLATAAGLLTLVALAAAAIPAWRAARVDPAAALRG
jgi:putative ABC transport system permease protein